MCKICQVADCGRKASSLGLCHKHYQRLRSQGDALRLSRREPGLRTREEKLESSRRSYQKNKERYSEKRKSQDRERYKAKKEKILEGKKEWRAKNKPSIRAATAKRRASKILATPKWLSESQLAEIRSFFLVAHERTVETGIQYHVDHIVPLRGKLVCGLHVPWNLQVIPARENLKKGNSLL